MYVRFLATSQIKQALKFKSSNCGQSTVVCGRFPPFSHLIFTLLAELRIII